jgi:hypothetical protein
MNCFLEKLIARIFATLFIFGLSIASTFGQLTAGGGLTLSTAHKKPNGNVCREIQNTNDYPVWVSFSATEVDSVGHEEVQDGVTKLAPNEKDTICSDSSDPKSFTVEISSVTPANESPQNVETPNRSNRPFAQGQTLLLIEGLTETGSVEIESTPMSQEDARQLASIHEDPNALPDVDRALAGEPSDKNTLPAATTLKPPIGPYRIIYAKDTVVLHDGSLISPDAVHNMPNSDDLHIKQDYFANTAALAVGHDVIVTSAYRDPKSSGAHANGAIDIRPPADRASRLAEAQKISAALANRHVLVLVEEVTQEGKEKIQVNTYFHDGVAGKPIKARQKPPAQRAKNDQFHASGTHIHIQPQKGFSVPERYIVALREDSQPGSEQHSNDGTIYKGPLKNGQPTGRGQQLNPDGTIWTGDFTNGFASPGEWQQTHPDGTVTDDSISANGDNTIPVMPSGRYENIDPATLKEGLPTGPGAFATRPGSSFGNSGSRFEGEFRDGILQAHGKKIYDNGDVEEGDFQDDKLNGKGKITSKDGETREGDFKDDELNGKGKITSKDGNIWEGNFEDGRLNGDGKVTLNDGQVREGYFNDSRLWKGKVEFKDGETHEGEFEDGRLINGKVTFKSGEIQEGNFTNGRLSFGKITFSDGHTAEGEFQNGRLNGTGVLKFVDGETYEGEFKNGRLDGTGKARSKDGQIQEGNFKDGHPEGHGIYTPSDHSYKFAGEYKDGVPVKGTVTTKNGDSFSGEMHNGQFGKGDFHSHDGSSHGGDFKDFAGGHREVAKDPGTHEFQGMKVIEERDGSVSTHDMDAKD